LKTICAVCVPCPQRLAGCPICWPQTWLKQLQTKWNDRTVLQSIAERCKANTLVMAAARKRRVEALTRRFASMLTGLAKSAGGGAGVGAGAGAGSLLHLLQALVQMEKEVLRRAGLAAVAEEKQREDALRAVAWTSATCFVAKTAAVGDAAARAIAAVRRPPPPTSRAVTVAPSLSLHHCRAFWVG
jgi:hypothetical protein